MPDHAKADVIIVGGGASGIAAATALASAGLSIKLLEARDRIGGRIFTLQDQKLRAPIELGAEFIHGRPPEILDLLKARHVQIREVDGDNWCVEEGRVSPCDFFSEVDQILQKMSDHKNGDESFTDFLKHYSSRLHDTPSLRQAKQWATGYVSGFNAADPALISVKWLLQGMRAEEEIEGDRAFRAEHGYADLIEIFQKQLQDSGISLQKNTVVESIQWRPGQVEITAVGATGTATFSVPRMLITVPLGVLQARTDDKGAISFAPELPQQKQNAIRNIAMGKVIRVTLRFRERFWEDLPHFRETDFKSMDRMSFLFSHDDWFPTWWATAPVKLPYCPAGRRFTAPRAFPGRASLL